MRCYYQVRGKMLGLEGAGSAAVTHIHKMCNGLRAIALLKVSELAGTMCGTVLAYGVAGTIARAFCYEL